MNASQQNDRRNRRYNGNLHCGAVCFFSHYGNGANDAYSILLFRRCDRVRRADAETCFGSDRRKDQEKEQIEPETDTDESEVL